MGGGGELTKFVCGYLSCDPQLSRVFLGALPPIFKVSIRDDPSGEWLENSIRYSVDNVDASRPGCGAVLAKLSEVLFAETLRRYIANLPSGQTGWLAGVRDPERDFPDRAGGEVSPLYLGNAYCLSDTLAASTWRADAHVHEQRCGAHRR